ncbi:hypothetical protein ACQRUO_22575, partial [Kitasatospora sp. LaBMicrA B282]
MATNPTATDRSTRLWLRCLPWLLIAIAVGYDLATPLPYTAAPLLAAAPPAAAALLSLTETALIGSAVVAICTVLALFRDDAQGHIEIWPQLGGLVALAVLTTALKRRSEHSSRQLAGARDVVEVLQRAVLPEPPARI